MKMVIIFAAVVLACVLVAPCSAIASGADAPAASLLASETLDRLSVGVGWDNAQRPVNVGTGIPDGLMESRALYAWAAVDICRWITIRGGGGESDVKSMPFGGYGDTGGMWLLGVMANLWEHEITKPSYAANCLRIQAAYTRWDHEADAATGRVSWNEERVSVVFAAEFEVEHAILNVENTPTSAVFSIGPVFSRIDGDSDSPAAVAAPGNGRVSFDETEDAGLLLGIDLKLARNLSIGWEGRLIDSELSHTLAGAFHF